MGLAGPAREAVVEAPGVARGGGEGDRGRGVVCVGSENRCSSSSSSCSQLFFVSFSLFLSSPPGHCRRREGEKRDRDGPREEGSRRDQEVGGDGGEEDEEREGRRRRTHSMPWKEKVLSEQATIFFLQVPSTWSSRLETSHFRRSIALTLTRRESLALPLGVIPRRRE